MKTASTAELTKDFTAAQGNVVPEIRFSRLSKCFNLTEWFQNLSDGVGRGAVTDNEMKQIRLNGISAVRLPFHPSLFDSSIRSQAAINASLAALDNAIDRLIANNLAVVLDAHDANGGVSLDSEAAIVRFIQTWTMLATRYANQNPDYLLFEVMNEPGDSFPTGTWSSIQNRVLGAIRAAAPLHTVLVTAHYNSFRSTVGMPLVPDNNVIYTVHFYDPMLFSHQGANWISSMPWLETFSGLDYPPYMPAVVTKLATSAEPAYSAIKEYLSSHWDAVSISRSFGAVAGWAKNNGVRLWLGEFGAHLWPSAKQSSPPIPVDARMRWLKDVRTAAEGHGIGWCMWDFKGNFGYINTLNGAYAPEGRVLTALGLAAGSINEAPASPYAFSTTVPVYLDAAVAASEPLPSNSNADALAVTDLTGDGSPDAVVTNIDWPPTSVERPIQLMINNGDGSFRSGNGLIAGVVPKVRRISRIITADFNRSGRNGLLFLEQGFNQTGGQNRLLLYSGADQYIDASGNLPQQTAQSVDADFADLRGLGPDLIVFNDWAGGTANKKPMQFWSNDGTGRFTLDQSRLPADLLVNHSFTSGKFIKSNNGLWDLLIFGNQDESSNWYLRNDGSGRFSKGAALPAKPFANKAYAVSVVSDDLNGDGLPDLVVAYVNGTTFTDSALQVLINNGNGTFRDETATRMPVSVYSSRSVRDLYLAPVAQSGRKDLLIKFSGNAPALRINNGDVFSPVGEDDAPVQNSSLIAPADLDGDGAIDLLLGTSVGEIHAVFGKKWFDPLVPQGHPVISSIAPGRGSATISFSTINTFDGRPAGLYRATCEAPGQLSRTGSGSSSPITVRGLIGNVAYQCSVVALSGGYTSTASATSLVVPTPIKNAAFAALILLLLD
jgi:aryl-phospho-beta-D-glucosidase BglC (GH1 family)